MKKLSLLILVALTAASLAMAQFTPPSGTGSPPGTGLAPPVVWGGDELGAHNCYGRGCVACHAPHGGQAGNGISTSDADNGWVALWGQNLSPYTGTTFTFTVPTARSSYTVTLPSTDASVSISDTASIVLLCLSCHDGNLARVSMMQGRTVETLPIVGGTAPTLFGLTPGNSGFNYFNEHPVGPNANVQCNGGSYVYGWDCTGGGNTLQPIVMNGTASSKFLTNYPASFWNAASYTACTAQPCTGTGCCPAGNTWGYTASGNPLSSPSGGTTANAVTCTTCHNQHDMIVWSVAGKNYTTMFFVKGYYNPYNGGNSVSQFCRTCHGGNSNEMAGLMNIPTW